MSGLSTCYVRTQAMNPRNQVSTQTMFDRLNGAVLSTADLLALCAAHGLDDARVEIGRVVAAHVNPRWGCVVLETALQVERLAAGRAAATAGARR